MRSSRTLTLADPDTQVQIAHFLIVTQGDGDIHPAQIELGFEWMPRSLGKNLLDLAYRVCSLHSVDSFERYGLCEEATPFSDVEATTYKLLAYVAEQALEQFDTTFGAAMKYKMAGLAMYELVYQPPCQKCNTSGCAQCNFLGRRSMPKTRRVEGLQTNCANWNKYIGRAYCEVFLPMVGSAERDAARVWLRTMQDRLPDRIEPVVAQIEAA